MPKLRSSTPALLTAVILMASAGTAAAQQRICFPVPGQPDVHVGPTSSDGPVPVNSLIWYHADRLTEEQLEDGEVVLSMASLDDGPVALESVGTVRTPSQLWEAFLPVDGELLPDHEYELRYDPDFAIPLNQNLFLPPGAPSGPVSVTFRTGSQRDDVAPAVPALAGWEAVSDYNKIGSRCDIQNPDDEAVFYLDAEPALQFIAEAGLGSSLAEDGPWGEGFAAGEGSFILVDEGLQPLASKSLRFASMDRAGNFSGWSEAESITLPAAGCARDVDGHLSSAWLLLAMLGLAPLRLGRRRRARGGRGGEFWLPMLLVGFAGLSLLAATALPTGSAHAATATATEPAAATEPAPSDPVARATRRPIDIFGTVSGDRAELDTAWKNAETGFGIATLVQGGFQMGFLALQPHRAPYALQLSIANTALWFPSLVGTITINLARIHLRTARSLAHLRSGLRRNGISMMVMGLIILQFAIPGSIAFAAVSQDPSLAFPVLSLALAPLVSAGALDGMVKAIEEVDTSPIGGDNRSPYSRRTGPRGRSLPRLVAAGPTGLILLF